MKNPPRVETNRLLQDMALMHVEEDDCLLQILLYSNDVA